MLRIRETWGLVSGKFLSDAAWYFYLFWLPKYLYDARGFDVKAVGATAWIPYSAAGVGCLLGGWFSSYLVKRHFSLNRRQKARTWIERGGDAVDPPGSAASRCVGSCNIQSGVFRTAVLVNHGDGSSHDLFPANVVGSVAGLVGFGGAMGGIAFGQLVGYLLDHGYGYGVVFALAGTFHIVAFAVILATIPAIPSLSAERKLSYLGAG